ncbi:MAG: glycoside hydrolase family 2 TIM barrel-domain containing protein [Clostridiales bacterium]|nr:glycoside hydrolase family 2 TIM barrel-domain containing protein [Clostridiales bacterium]
MRRYTDEVLNKAVSVIREMIKRDKNHPSIIMWSLANEPMIETDEGDNFFKVMAKTARTLNSTRPITFVAFYEPENTRGMQYYDICCINKYQAKMIKLQYEKFKEQPYAVRTHVWAFADFKTAQTISRIVFNRKGVFTREREPKMAAHMLKELWNE